MTLTDTTMRTIDTYDKQQELCGKKSITAEVNLWFFLKSTPTS